MITLWLAVILFANTYTGQALVVDNPTECANAVAYARTVVPAGFSVPDCVAVTYGAAAPRTEVQTP